MHNDNLISIIIPAYNIEKYLSKCLDSVLSQTYDNLEIIVVSDGSTDGTNDIIKQYAKKDSRIKPVYKENSGVSDTRARGIEEASGSYIGFVDGDDTIDPDMYELLIKNAQKYNADISHCGYNLINSNGTYPFYGTGDIEFMNHDKGIMELLSGEKVEPGLWNKLYKKDLFRDLKYDRSIRINEDLLINVLLFNKANCSIFEDVTKYNYILRENSASQSKINDNKLYDPIKVTAYILDLFKNSDTLYLPALERYISCNINSYKFAMLHNFSGVQDFKIFIESNLKRVKKYFKKISKKNRYMSYGIMYFPWLFKLIYFVFDKTHKERNKHHV